LTLKNLLFYVALVSLGSVETVLE